MVSQAIAAVEPVGGLVRSIQRFLRAHEHGNVRVAKFRRVQRIAGGLLNGDVSRDGGNRQHADLRRAQRHDQSDGVIGGGVGVNQEERFHSA